MASCALPVYTAGVNGHRGSCPSAPAYNYAGGISSTRFCFSSSKINFSGSFFSRRKLWSGSCRATGPPEDPSSDDNQQRSPGLIPSITRFQDSMQIFFAVLLWMSFFFWSSAWDGLNGGKRDKDSRFRK